MRRVLLAVFVASVSSYAAAADQPPTGAAGGKIIFREVCATCHGVDARGTGPVARSLKTPPADLTQITKRHGGSFPADEVKVFIDGRKDVAAHGSRQMPVWGDSLAQAVSDEGTREERIQRAIEMLVEYLQTLQQ